MRFVMRHGVLVLSLVLSGCSWFGGDDEEVKPAELKPINVEVKLAPLWDRGIGGAAMDRASKLVPAVYGGRVFAASADGTLTALEPGTGRVIWKKRIQEFYSKEDRATAFADKSDAITGGVGAGRDILVVGTFSGEIVAVNQSDGSLAWRSRTTSEVLAPPQVEGDLVVAQTIDGKVGAYDVIDGSRRWLYSTLVPSLTLRGTSTPILTPNFVIAGFANGRVAVLDRERGLAGIDQRIAVAQGKSDLERLVDVDGEMVLSGNDLYAASYQGNLVCIDLSSRRVRWSMEASSTVGLGSGFGNVYLASADSTLSAVDMSNGRVLWKTEALKNRDITTPRAISSYIAVGDLEGYLHLVAQADGRFVARQRVAGDALRSPVVVDGSRMYVMTPGGRLRAFELQ
jgi:outer membrane protein assembly factor BamB